MSFFQKIFGRKQEAAPPNIHFGRHAEAWKRPEQERAWEEAMAWFDEGRSLDAYQQLFLFLENDLNDNIELQVTASALEFKLLQGSKRIEGRIDHKWIRVYTRVTRSGQLGATALHELLEQNFAFRYARFGIDEQGFLVMLVDAFTRETPPNRLYEALKELAVHADKMDDLLNARHGVQLAEDMTVIRQLPEREKGIKWKYLHAQIQGRIQLIRNGALDCRQYPGACTYLLLSLVYKLDYLLKPEGLSMEAFERIHRLSFSSADHRSVHERNEEIIRELQHLVDRPKAQFMQELYEVTHTFGITTRVGADRIRSVILSELPQADWYLEHGYREVACCIPRYIVGYCLFNYTPPPPVNALLHLFFEIMEADFFQQLGFENQFQQGTKLNRKAIRKAIDHVLSSYEGYTASGGALDFEHSFSFMKSYLHWVASIEETKQIENRWA